MPVIDPTSAATGPLSDQDLAAWRGMLQIHAQVTQALDAQMRAEHDLSVSSYEVLMFLGDAESRRMRMAEIAERVLLSRSGLTRLVDRLVELGYVRRCASEDDKRGLYAELTDSGAKKLEAARRTHLEGVREYFLEHLSTTDKLVLGDIWTRVLGVDQAARRPATRPAPDRAQRNMADPLIIQCAVTGSATPDPERRPNLPVTPEQIIEAALAAWQAGATVLHLHAREDDGTPTQDREAFARLVDGIRAAGCDAVLNLSCGTAGGRSARDGRLAPLDLEPEMASFDCGTINFGDRIFEGDLPFLRRMAEAFRHHGVRPELECFDTGHVGLALQLQREGLLPPDPLIVQFVLGVPGTGVPASVRQVEHLRGLLPAVTRWFVAAAGAAQLPMTAYCILAGGHVRTGLEDNLHYRRGERATNAQLVERVVRLAAELDRPVADAAQARDLLGLARPVAPAAR